MVRNKWRLLTADHRPRYLGDGDEAWYRFPVVSEQDRAPIGKKRVQRLRAAAWDVETLVPRGAERIRSRIPWALAVETATSTTSSMTGRGYITTIVPRPSAVSGEGPAGSCRPGRAT